MKIKNTAKILGPIESEIVARLSYEKKTVVTTEELDVLFDLWAVSVPRRAVKPLLADMDQSYRRYTGWLAGIIDEGVSGGIFRQVDSTSVASMIMALLDGLMFQAVLGVIELDPKKTSENLSRTLLDGIKK